VFRKVMKFIQMKTFKKQTNNAPALWCVLDHQLKLGPLFSRSEWAVMFEIIADQMEEQIAEDAGPGIGVYYKENPMAWLRKEAIRARSKGFWGL